MTAAGRTSPSYAAESTDAMIDFAYQIEAQSNGAVEIALNAAQLEACFWRWC